MKKKYIISIMAACAFFLGMPSCTNLDETVYDKIPTDEFGKTQAQINSIIAPVYKSLKDVWPGSIFVLTEEASDMAITPTRRGGDWWDGGQHMEMKLHTWTSRTGVIRDAWNSISNGIATCNMVYNIIEGTEMDANLKALTLAEIRGVRAFWYYQMIDNFGNGPLTVDFQDTSLPGMTPRAELYAFVMSELNDIKDSLREDFTGASYGKFSKGAAYTLLAKMYLNAEVWIGAPNWQGVVDACDEVISLGYIIEPNWKTSFLVHNEVSKEAILGVPFGSVDGGNSLHYRTLHYLAPIALGMNVGTWNGISAQPDYVNMFHPEDQRFEGSFLMGPLVDPSTGKVLITAHGFELDHTVEIPTLPGTEKDGTLWGEADQHVGARCNKWVFEVGLSSADQENDYHLFRLADVYLMKAEALVRLGRDNAEATSLVNTIRERGFGNSNHNYTNVTLDDIYLERRLELAWECVSRQDMIRFGTFLDAGYLRPGRTPEFRLLFPIPFQAYETNNNLVQNPGYPAF